MSQEFSCFHPQCIIYLGNVVKSEIYAHLSSNLEAPSSQHFDRPKKSSFNEARFRHAFLEHFEEAQSMHRHSFFFFIAKKDMDHQN